jgi:hypothetical protein
MVDIHTASVDRAELRSKAYDPRDAWREPDQRLLNGGVRKAPEFPLDCLGSIGPWVADLAASKGAPVDYAAGPFLAFCAGAVGAARVVRVRQNWVEPPILWIASVGRPSSGKSPPLAALKRAYMEIERGEAGDMAERKREHETRRVEAAAIREKWEAGAKEAAKKGQTASPMPAEADEPEEPRAPRMMVADATTEKLARIIADNPRGVISVRDELAGLLGNFGKYGGEDAPFYLQAYGGDFSPVDRVKGGTITAERAYLSIVGAIQPDKVQGLLSGRANDGLVSRFLPIWPDAAKRVWEVPAVDEVRAVSLFSRLRALSMDTDADGRLSPRALPLDPAASEIFAAWWKEQGGKTNEAAGFFSEFLGKSDGTCARLALVLELIEWAATGKVPDDGPRSVSADSVERACRFFAEYFEPMARRVYADASLPEAEQKAVALVKEIQRRRVRQFNAREVYREWGIGGIGRAADVEAACNALIEGDCIAEAERPDNARGRRAKDYVVNPYVLMGDA